MKPSLETSILSEKCFKTHQLLSRNLKNFLGSRTSGTRVTGKEGPKGRPGREAKGRKEGEETGGIMEGGE
jgi:hypothetical protein